MKNLINAVTNKWKGRLNDFIKEINPEIELKKIRENWKYRDLIPKGKDVSKMNQKDLIAYLIKRKEKAIYKAIEEEVAQIKAVFSTGELIRIKITMEWKKNRTWRSNPTAECWYTTKSKAGQHSHYVKSGSIGGCGYDKGSTAVAECLNQIPELKKLLYAVKEKSPKADNRELFGYGSGYGILPSFEGGVGVSCYPHIMEKVGFTFETVASGKAFDVFQVNKLTERIAI